MTLDAQGKAQIIPIETPKAARRASVFEDDDEENAFSDTFLVEGEKVFVRELSNDAINRYRADEAATVALGEIAQNAGADFGALCEQAQTLLERTAQGQHYLAKVEEKIAAASEGETPDLLDPEVFGMMATALRRAFAARVIGAGVVDWELTRGNGEPAPYSGDAVLRMGAKAQFELCERLVHYSVFGQDLADFLPSS